MISAAAGPVEARCHGDHLTPVLSDYKARIARGKNRSTENYGQKEGVLYTIRSEMVQGYQIYKNYRRRVPNLGVNVNP